MVLHPYNMHDPCKVTAKTTKCQSHVPNYSDEGTINPLTHKNSVWQVKANTYLICSYDTAVTDQTSLQVYIHTHFWTIELHCALCLPFSCDIMRLVRQQLLRQCLFISQLVFEAQQCLACVHQCSGAGSWSKVRRHVLTHSGQLPSRYEAVSLKAALNS